MKKKEIEKINKIQQEIEEGKKTINKESKSYLLLEKTMQKLESIKQRGKSS
jgi:hypothetical protein